MSRNFLIFQTSILLLTALTSCKDYDKKDEISYDEFIERRLVLAGVDSNYNQKDTLCFLSIKTPDRLDTFYQWQDYGDYGNDRFTKYRFSDHRYIQYPESGFIYMIQPDSVYQLTIWHKRKKEIPDSIGLPSLSKSHLNDNWYFGVHQTTFSPDSVQYIKKEFRVINDKPFIVSAYKTQNGYLTWRPTIFVVAITNLKNRELFFIAECGAKDTTGFIDNMYKSFLSIRIKENP